MIALQKCGMPPKVCTVQGATLAEMKYNLMTGLGLSDLDYQHCATHPIYGTGQGSAASPVIWIVLLNHLIECHEHVGHSARHSSPNGAHTLDFNVVGFVDDCSCQVTGDNTTPDGTLIERMQKAAQLWRDLLNVTGGELSEKKCTHHFTKYSFDPSGAPFLNPKPTQSRIIAVSYTHLTLPTICSV